MDFETFAARARQLADAIPSEFMEGVETVDVHEDVLPHPLVPDVFTLGECVTSPHSDPSGQEPFRSVVHLYYGSFVALAESDPSFDVEAELKETIEHEVQHHIEDRAGANTLHDEDALFEAHARFRAGLEVPAGWYRQGEPIAPGLWAVDLDLFLEVNLRPADWAPIPGTRLVLNVLDEPFEIDVPKDAQPDEVWTFEGEGLVEGDEDEDEDEDDADDEETDDDASAGLAGALHVIPVVR
jgi:hypothetical protein